MGNGERREYLSQVLAHGRSFCIVKAWFPQVTHLVSTQIQNERASEMLSNSLISEETSRMLRMVQIEISRNRDLSSQRNTEMNPLIESKPLHGLQGSKPNFGSCLCYQTHHLRWHCVGARWHYSQTETLCIGISFLQVTLSRRIRAGL